MGHQSSLDQNVVEEDGFHDVVARVDFGTHILAAADDMVGVERKPSFAAPTLGLGLLLRDQFFPLPDAEEVLLYFPDDLHRLGSAVEGSPCLREDSDIDRALVGDDPFSETSRTLFLRIH